MSDQFGPDQGVSSAFHGSGVAAGTSSFKAELDGIVAHGLNPDQQKAVDTLSGPLLVLAGAGTGKTRVVTFRIANLIRHGTAPNRILAVTFTNKAAAEMQERIGGLLGKKLKEKPEVSTFHSLCVRILRRHIRKLGYPEKFAIYDRSDQESVARGVLREIRVSTQMLRPGDLLAIISRWKSGSIRPEDARSVAETDKEHLAAVAYRRYQQALKNAGAVDFDDLLICTEDLFRHFPDVRQEEAKRFDHLLVDEYQDTNASQYRIVKALADRHRNLCVVGDDDQSIYGWRGAEVQHILRFAKDWRDATVVRLEDNYRSTSEIIHMANTLIVFNKHRHDKVLRAARAGGEKPKIQQLKDETVEAKTIVQDIKSQMRMTGRDFRDFAILFRTNEQPRVFETELRRAGVPYILIGGMSFFDRKEVRDILSYLRLMNSPQDEVSMLRVINTPPRGLGAKSVQAIMETAVSQGVTVWDIMSNPSRLPALPPAAQAGVQRLVELVRKYGRQFQDQDMVSTMQGLIGEINYEGELHRLYPDPNEQQARWATVQEVVNAMGSYAQKAKQPTLTDFLDELALAGREQDKDKEKELRQNAVALMTLHSAKGLEFPHVYMVGMEEGILPHHRSVAAEGDAIDEERRLCYVGITRAEERLTMSLALTRMKWGKPRDTVPSRFLYEAIGQADNPNRYAAKKSPVKSPSARRPAKKKATRRPRSAKRPSATKKSSSPKRRPSGG